MAIVASNQISIVDVTDGAEGKGVSSVTPEYYLSASKTTQTGGSWNTTPPTWSSGKYLWVRHIVTYTDSSVSRTQPYCDTSWEAVKEIEIGSRNLLLNTKTFTEASSTSLNGSLITGTSLLEEKYRDLAIRGCTVAEGETVVCLYNFTDFNLGDTFTFSFYAKGDVSELRAYFYGNPGYVQVDKCVNSQGATSTNHDGWSSFYITSDWQRYWVTWTLKSTGDISVPKYVLLRTKTATSGQTVYVCGCKLEKGNKATDWSPAPEDVNHAIDSIQVGGRNLLYYSRFDKKYPARWAYSEAVSYTFDGNAATLMKSETTLRMFTTQASVSNGVVAANPNLLPENGCTYTISCEIMKIEGYYVGGGTTVTVRYNYTDGTVKDFAIDILEASETEWTKYSRTFVYSSDKELSYVQFIIALGAKACGIRIKNVKLEKGNKATDWSPAPEDVDDAIDNIQVGGRNLLLNTGESSSIIGTNTADQCLAHHDLACGSITKLEAGEYTCSADIIGTVEGGTAHMQFYGPPWETIPEMSGNVTIKTTKQKIGGTFTLTSPQSFSATGMRVRTDNVSGTITVSNMKLEKGNKATDWSPAPEDVEADATKKANEAAKTATNYMKMLNYDGLIIGDMTADTLGKNVLIDSDSVDIRNGDTVLASYGDNIIYLGKNNRNATIDFCDGLGKIYNYIHNDKEHLAIESTDVYIASSTYPRDANISLTTTNDSETIKINAAHMYGSDVYGSIIDMNAKKIDIGIYYISPQSHGEKEFDSRIYSEYEKGTTITGKTTISGTLVLSKTTDASGTANNSPALIVGGTATTSHIEIDSNEIMAKSNGTTPTTLSLNVDGGQVYVGSGGIKTPGNVIGICQIVKMGSKPATIKYQSDRTKALIEFWKTSVGSSNSHTVYDSAYVTGLSNKMTAKNVNVSNGPDFSFTYSISKDGEISVSGTFSKYRITYFN